MKPDKNSHGSCYIECIFICADGNFVLVLYIYTFCFRDMQAVLFVLFFVYIPYVPYSRTVIVML